MTPERFDTLRRVLDRRQTTLTMLMENVHKPHNYSAVLRSCDAVGVYEAHAIQSSEVVQTYPLIDRSAAKWVHVRVHPEMSTAKDRLRQAGFRLVATIGSLPSSSDDAIDYRQVDYTEPVAIVLGAEKDGLTAAAIAAAEVHVRIPMEGVVRSLNVSVAAAVILFEAQRQRVAAGLYDRRHLADDVYTQTLFEWAHPEIAAHCRSRGVAYPELDTSGEIVGDFPR